MTFFMLLFKEYSNGNIIIFCTSVEVCICYSQSAIKPFSNVCL